MADYFMFGSELSTASQKVRAYMRYKGIDFEAITPNARTLARFKALAPIATLPVVIDKTGAAKQDSSIILADLEKNHPDPICVPDYGPCGVLALILEEYGDEWLAKAVLNQRWSQSETRKAIMIDALDESFGVDLPTESDALKTRFDEVATSGLSAIGAGTEQSEILNESWKRFAMLLNTHLEKHLFLFGSRPSIADFSLAAQLQQLLAMTETGEWLRDETPFLAAWCEFMEDPRAGGDFEKLDTLKETLLPIFAEEIAITFLPWAAENSSMATKRKKEVTIKIARKTYTQATQKHAAKAYKAMVKTVQKHPKDDGLEAFYKAAKIKTYFK